MDRGIRIRGGNQKNNGSLSTVSVVPQYFYTPHSPVKGFSRSEVEQGMDDLGWVTDLMAGAVFGIFMGVKAGVGAIAAKLTTEYTAAEAGIISKAASEAGLQALNIEQRTLQHVFSRHAKDFGITKPWSKSAATEFENVVRAHVKGLTPIKGTYRGTQQVLHYFNPNNGVNVMTDMSGNLVSGWKLGSEQIMYLLSTGSVK